MCSNAPETWQKLLRGCLGEGRERGNGEVSPGFKFQDENFCMSNSFQLQEPLDNIGNPKFPGLCTGQALPGGRMGFQAALRNRMLCLSAHRMRLLEACGKRSPRLGRLFLSGRGGGARRSRQRFRGKAIIWQVSGRLSPAHSWPQLAAGSLRSARPLPKVLPERGRAAGGRAAKRGAGGRGRALSRITLIVGCSANAPSVEKSCIN